MQQDDMIWHCLGNGFCSFKVKTKTQIMCKNEYNNLGLCCKSGCPLANSNYATVREHKGIVYLCKKVVERATFPAKMWEKIKLPSDYQQALAKIEELLPYWNARQLHRCKQRYTKIYQYLQSCRKDQLKMRQKKIITLPRKMERREKAREKKALLAAKIENNIELEVLNRVKMGVYSSKYAFKDANVFEKALTEAQTIEQPKSKSKQKIEVTTKEKKLANKYIEDIEDMAEDSDNETIDFESHDEDEDDDDYEHEKLKARKKQKILIQYD